MTIIKEGALGIYELKEYNLMVLRLDDWQYSLNKQIPVMTQQNLNRKIYILPTQSGTHIGIVLGKQIQQELSDCFESILFNNCNYVVPDEQAMKLQSQEQQQELKKQQSHCQSQLQQDKPKEEEKSTSQQISSFLSKGGQMIKTGLIAGATFLSEGIVQGGKLIQTKITKPKPINVSPDTVAKVKLAKAGSAAMVQYTKAQVESMVAAAKVIGGQIGDQIGQSETGQKIKNHKDYEDVKTVAKGTVNALANVYDGMYEALCLVGRGFQQATTEVVTTKYGEQAGALTNDSLDTVGNVGQLGRVYKDVAVKNIIKSTDEGNQK